MPPSPSTPLPDPIHHAYDDGAQEWRLEGELHRADGPALITRNGSQEWWWRGIRHRLDGPAVEQPNGYRSWHVDGQRHREDGPAVEAPGKYRSWWHHGKRHREDGPAIEWANGECEWYLHDRALLWALPTALWAHAAAREALTGSFGPIDQRQRALDLLPTLPIEVQQAAVTEALRARDPEQRLWGMRAAALLSPAPVVQTNDSD